MPIAFIVFRSILGFSPPELAYMTTETTGVSVDQGAARAIDRRVRLNPCPLELGITWKRILAMIEAGVKTWIEVQTVPPAFFIAWTRPILRKE